MFVMAGACPSVFPPTGMQAVVYTAMGDPRLPQPTVDFWWLKPAQGNASHLEQMTLNRHAKGSHKNDPGRSKVVYGPIAALFNKSSTSADGKLKFGVNGMPPDLSGQGQVAKPRAYIDCLTSRVRYYLCWVWLEDWSSPANPLAKKWLKGKLIYQKEGFTGQYFARPFKFVDGDKGGILLPSGPQLEERVNGVLPPATVKLGCVV